MNTSQSPMQHPIIPSLREAHKGYSGPTKLQEPRQPVDSQVSPAKDSIAEDRRASNFLQYRTSSSCPSCWKRLCEKTMQKTSSLQ